MATADREDDGDSVSTAEGLVARICDTIEYSVPEKAKVDNAQYFEDVEKKAKDIGASVERMRRATPGQIKALQNMLAGVKKWVHDGDEEDD